MEMIPRLPKSDESDQQQESSGPDAHADVTRGAAVPFDGFMPTVNLAPAPAGAAQEVTVAAGSRFRGQSALYEVTEKLGRGGMGSVYLARMLPADATDSPAGKSASESPFVALKLFYSTDPTVLSSLLERELSALRAIRHDRIPPVLDWSTDPHSPFVVFPYYAAGSLADFIAVNGSLSTVNAIRLLHDVLSALVAAHRACLLHLDIKPHNVLLDGTGGYMLADFGVAQGSFVAQYGICMGLGTIGFQSPEQLDYSSGEFDARVDIWGVGITAWAAVTGVTQQTIRNLRLQNIANDHALPAPSQIGAVCPPELERLIMSMLYHDRGKRPAGASEVLSLVRSLALDGEKRSESAIKLCDLKVYGSAETAAAASELMDPIWKSILATQQLSGNIVEYDDGVTILEEGEESYNAFVLLKGAYEIFRDGRLLACEDREGSFLGEITALAGERRTATARAKGRTRLLSLNAAEFEHFLARNPAITMRLLKTLAARIHQASETEDSRKRPL